MPKFDIKRKFYALASTDGENAEIQMYGDVVEKWPTDWWTGEKLEGNYIAQDEFLKDLAAVEGCKSVTIRLNSYGGDAVVGIVIHNRLREIAANGTHLTCIVDGVAMSAGSVIMCACDTVKVNPSSLVMIHKGWSFLFGRYNADELRKSAEASPVAAEELTPYCILADDVTVGKTADAVAVAYRCGNFNRSAVIAKSGHTLSAADEDALRHYNIILTDVM